MSEKRRDSKGRILRDGEGERKDRRKSYIYQYTDKNTGNKGTLYAYTLHELRQLEDELNGKLKNNVNVKREKLLLNDVFKKYMELHKRSIRETTAYNCQHLYEKHIENDSIGKMQIKDIRNEDIQDFLWRVKDQNDTMKKSSIKRIYILLHAVFKYAKKNKYILDDPSDDAMIELEDDSEEKKHLTAHMIEKLEQFCQNSKHYNRYLPFIQFALETGLRSAELLAITKDDINTENMCVSVTKQLKYRTTGKGCGFYLDKPKTKTSVRTVMLTSKALKAYTMQKKINVQLGVTYDYDVDGVQGFLFQTEGGRPYTPQGVDSFLKRIREAYNRAETELAEKEHRVPVLLPCLSCHILRHSHATLSIQAGANPSSVAGMLGHKSSKITCEVYDHSRRDFEWIRREYMRVGIS